MKLAERLERIPPYLFVEISRRIAEKKAAGKDVVTFGIGDPDLPTPKHILDVLAKETYRPSNHRYPETSGLPELCDAIAFWYDRRFHVDLDSSQEVLPLIGAKEGIAHLALCLIEPGEIALIPDPGYPVYKIGVLIAGGEPYFMRLQEKDNWLPDLNKIPRSVAEKAACLWINYPNNPTGAVADLAFFEECVAFAKKYQIPLLHDNAYSEVAYDGYNPVSVFEIPGAKDVAIEIHSLSKTYNMTGWRIGMAVGNSYLVQGLSKIKSNLDSGIPQAIQYAAIEALTGSQENILRQNEIYRIRRDAVVDALSNLGLTVAIPKAGLYVWARVPKGFTSAEFAGLMLEEQDIVVTPGTGYGDGGEGYIRLSLTIPDDELTKGLARLQSWKIPT